MHCDLEYHVDLPDGTSRAFGDPGQAAILAVAHASATGKPWNIDVVVMSEQGAYAFGGDDAVLKYREDPEASVFERIVIKAESIGRIP